MIEFVKGRVHELTLDQAIVDVNGVGYGVYTSIQNVSCLKPDQTVMFYTHYSVREDGASLYGFLSREELDMFRLLISVSKVGPKAALAILSTYPVDSICQQIMTHNLNQLAKAPGIGKKSAERIVLELKDKVRKMGVEPVTVPSQESLFEEEVIEALISLGYQKNEAFEAVRATADQGISTEECLKAALAWLMK